MSASRIVSFGLVLSVGATGLVGCGGDSSGSAHDGGTGGSGAASTGGSGASGSGASGGASGTGASGSGASGSGASGSGASGGSAACPPECFVANQCVTSCGQAPTSYGCCPCPAGMINALTCGAPSSDAGTGAVSCDTRSVLCKRLAPTCAMGEVASVVGQCYGPCVKIDACVCSTGDECPNPDEYTCHLSQKRCGPFVN